MDTTDRSALVTLEDSELDQVEGGLGSPVVPQFQNIPADLFKSLISAITPSSPPSSGTSSTGLFGLGGLFGIF